MRVHHGNRTVASVLAVLALCLGVAVPDVHAGAVAFSAPVAVSVPIPPTDVMSSPSAAISTGGAAVAIWQEQTAAQTMQISVASTSDGQHWSAPTPLGEGIRPEIAIGPDGTAVAVWEAVTTNSVLGISASVHPVDGSWSTPVAVSTTGAGGAAQVALDGTDDAVATWVDGSGAVLTATLPTGGAWSAPVTLAASGGVAPDVAVSAGGAVVIGWNTSRGAIQVASGTVGGGLSAPVTLAAAAFRQQGVRVAVSDSGRAAALWRGRTTVLAATRDSTGTWTAPTQVTSSASDAVDVAMDSNGAAVGVFIESIGGGASFLPFWSRIAAGGAWSAPVQLAGGSSGDITSPRIAATPAGSFVAVFADDDALTTDAVTSAPSQTFGAAVQLGTGGAPVTISAVPGHAIAAWSGPGPATTVATEPVS